MGINAHSLEKAGKVKVDGGEVGFRLYVPHDPVAAKRMPLLVIHGRLGGSSIGMYDSMHALADERPVLFYDQLGSYLSPAKMTKKLMKPKRFAEEPLHLMKALGIKKAAVLGYSWGGALATMFALNHPKKVAGLVLCSPLLSMKKWQENCDRLLQAFPAAVRDTIRAHEARDELEHPDYLKADGIFARAHFSRAANPSPALIAEKARTNRKVYETMWGKSDFVHRGTLGGLELTPRLKEISVPTLLTAGQYDVVTPDYMKEVQAEIKNSTLGIIPGAAHATMIDNNEAFVRMVGDFLRDTFDPAPQTAAAPAPRM